MTAIVDQAVIQWLDSVDLETIRDAFHATFWNRVDKTGKCWIWQGQTDDFGYGRLRPKTYGVKSNLAHRASWVLSGNPDPGELCVLHNCDNPPCVRPDHLFLGTRQDNSADMMAKSRHRVSTDPQFFTKGMRNAKAKLTNEQVIEIRQRAKSGEHYTAVAKAFGLSPTHACGIINGRSWRHIWPYFEERSSLPKKPVIRLRRRRAKSS